MSVSVIPSYAQFKSEDVTVSTSLTTLYDSTISGLVLHGRGLVSMAIANATGEQALNAFNIDVKPHPDANWFTLIGGTGWDSASAFMLYVTTDPVGLAAAGTSMAAIDLHANYAFRIQASVASATATVSVWGQLMTR